MDETDKFIILLIILMTTRLEKLEKIRLPPPTGRPEGASGTPVTQTIIINNPNININYMNESSRANGPLSSRGLDNWNLNNNLKEFSQTRQLGFFKTKKERNKSNSPYIIHKVRTQDIRSINKIYGGNAMKETGSTFRKNETISHIQPHLQQESQRNQSPLEKIGPKRDKTIAEKMYQGQVRKNLRVELQKNFETLPTNHLTNPEQIRENKHSKGFRRGRFELPSEKAVTPATVPRQPSKESSESVSSPGRGVKMEDKDERSADSSESDSKPFKKINPRMVPLQLRKRAFNRTIASIDKTLLDSTADYLQRFQGEKLPQSQIELCVNSMSHPQHVVPSRQRSSQREFNSCREYDFQFQEEKKKRPRTPRKKKFYDPNAQ